MDQVGRLNRARIDRDRYEPLSNPPVYKVSLYLSLREAPPAAQQPQVFKLQDCASPPKQQAEFLTRSQVLARDLRPDFSSPRSVAASPKIVPLSAYSSPYASPATTPYRASLPAKVANSPLPPLLSSSSNHKRPPQHQSPLVTTLPQKAPSPVRKPLPSASRYSSNSAVDSMIKQALSLQKEGHYEDAHVLLLQVEQMRLEDDRIVVGKQETFSPQVQQPSPQRRRVQPSPQPKPSPPRPAQLPQNLASARRASLVLEQVKLEQQQTDDGFDSLDSSSDSEQEEEHQFDHLPLAATAASFIAPKSRATSARQEEDKDEEKEFEEEDDLVEEDAVPMPPRVQPDVTLQAHQVSRTDLERERGSLKPPTNRGRRKSQTEELLERVFRDPLHQAVSFSDQFAPLPTAEPEMETVTVDEEEAKQTLRVLNRELTSSRLPDLASFRAASSEAAGASPPPQISFTNKEGYLLKLSENPTGFSRFRSQKSLTHKRYFRLTGGVLVHAKTQDSKIPRGMISLEEAVVEFVRCEGIQFGYCVAIKAEARNYTLFPETKQDAVEWVVALENNIQAVKQQKREEEAKNKLAARRKLTDESYKLNASFSLIPTESIQALVGMDVTSPQFTDLAMLNSANGGGDLPLIGGLYDLLGVTPSSSLAAIKKAYYRLAKVYHPDKKNTDAAFAAKFAEISNAFGVLSDVEAKSRYDQGERVKYALRRGVQVTVVELDGTKYPAALYIGPSMKFLYYQPVEFGPVLRDGFQFCELRFVQEIQAGEDCGDWPGEECSPEDERVGLRLSGQRLGTPRVFLELDFEASRNEILDGLRTLRCEQSVLFAQTLDTWLHQNNKRR